MVLPGVLVSLAFVVRVDTRFGRRRQSSATRESQRQTLRQFGPSRSGLMWLDVPTRRCTVMGT
jgi:hypothetical protein